MLHAFFAHCIRRSTANATRRRRCTALRRPLAIERLEDRRVLSTYYVATNGNDSSNGLSQSDAFRTIQHGLNAANKPGDSVLVAGGTYHERLTFPHSGSAQGGYITLEPVAGEHVLLSGQNTPDLDTGFGDNMVQITNKSYVKLIGFEIAYASGVAVQDDAFAVRVQGSGSNIDILDNDIHDITGQVIVNGNDNVGYAGAGIHVYGASLTTPISNVVIDGNTIYGCQPGDDETETLTVNGNVTNFQITNNIIHDDNNIGIDMIGGEPDTFGLPKGTQNLPVARDGVCSGNTVYNIHANYGGGYAAGIYVDGAQDITITDNRSYHNDYGLEVGAENQGYVASGITVENCTLFDNRQGGLVIGGYAASVGRVEDCRFVGNIVYDSDTTNTGDGALEINWASGNVIAGNIFVASANNVLIGSSGVAGSNFNNVLDDNVYYAPGGTTKAKFNFNNLSFTTFAAYANATHEDAHSMFANPLTVSPQVLLSLQQAGEALT